MNYIDPVKYTNLQKRYSFGTFWPRMYAKSTVATTQSSMCKRQLFIFISFGVYIWAIVLSKPLAIWKCEKQTFGASVYKKYVLKRVYVEIARGLKMHTHAVR